LWVNCRIKFDIEGMVMVGSGCDGMMVDGTTVELKGVGAGAVVEGRLITCST